MPWLNQLDSSKLLLFTVVLTRVSGLTMTAPIYGTRDVPAQARGLLAVILAVLITPVQWSHAVPAPPGVFPYLVLLASELLIGMSLGLGIVVLISGMQLAGEMVGRASGLMLSDIYDPTLDSSVPLIGQVLSLVATAVFVCIGGHRMLMSALLDTFQTLPPGGAAMAPASLVETFSLLVSESLSVGIRASIPAVTALLLATVVLGLVGRTLPQLNVMILGFSLNGLLTFAILALTLGAAAWVFQERVEPAVTTLLEGIHAHG